MTADRFADVLARMDALLAGFAPTDPRRHFLAAYRRTTEAVRHAAATGAFDDSAWVERWDVAFAQLYLDALEAPTPPAPWRQAFSAHPELPPLRHVLLGINAHINYDLPQALLAVITDDELDDPRLVARRKADHERIDAVLASRVAAEDAEVVARTEGRTVLDRLLTPVNHKASQRFLREARQKVWANTLALSCARRAGPEALAGRRAELEELSARRVADLLAPGQVVLRLARDGFGVRLPGITPMRTFDPVRVGTAERDAWVTYYQRDWARFLRSCLVLVSEGFALGRPATVRGAWLILRANQAWAPYPDNDPRRATELMRRFYALVARTHGEGFDPAEAARREIAWWRAHREAQHDATIPPSRLIDALVALYAYVYDADPAAVTEAAALRAAAMRTSDEWVAVGCDPASPLLASERDDLVASYGALLRTVRCGPARPTAP